MGWSDELQAVFAKDLRPSYQPVLFDDALELLRALNQKGQSFELDAEGLVARDARTRHYTLGPLVHELGLSAGHRPGARDRCGPAMRAVAGRTGDTVFLTMRSGLDSVCIDRTEGAFPIKTLTLEGGGRLPLGVGAGNLAMLAGLSDDDVARALERTAPQVARYPNLDIGRIRAVVEGIIITVFSL